MTQSALTYSSYLQLDTLLDAQRPQSAASATGPEHDELLFIVVHQVYELWFKQLLHELDFANKRFHEGDVGRSLHTLKRVRAILKVVVGQIDVLETMTPVEFNSFRARLDRASGLQSYQFREVEFALGMKDPAVLERYRDQPAILARLEQRLAAPSLWDAFLVLLERSGHDLPAELTDDAVLTVLVRIYGDSAMLAEVCEALTDIDEGLQEWRYRHVKMVQRTIGTKGGTGGTDGVTYLWSTLSRTLFPLLWAVRARL